MLELKDLVHQRGADGKLLPLIVELETLREYETVDGEDGKKKEVMTKEGPSVKITPLGRGEIQELSVGLTKRKKEGKEIFETTEDQDAKIIKEHLIEPKIPDEQIKDLKNNKFAGAVAIAIMAISFEIDQKTMQEAGKAAIQKYAEKLDGDLEKK